MTVKINKYEADMVVWKMKFTGFGIPDLAVHEGLGEHGLIDFVVSIPTV